MIRSSAGMPRVSKTLRYALSGAAMSLALAALSSPGQAVTFFCDDDLVNRNFTCGSAATTAGSTFSTAVGDSASATEGGGTAVGTSAVADGGGSTAVGTAAVASGGGSTAVGHSSQAIGESSIAVGFQAVAGFHDSTHNLSNSGATAIGTNAEAGTGGLGQDNATAVGQGAVANAASATAVGQQASANFSSASAFGQGAVAGAAIRPRSARTRRPPAATQQRSVKVRRLLPPAPAPLARTPARAVS